jgi:hypothetical protein
MRFHINAITHPFVGWSFWRGWRIIALLRFCVDAKMRHLISRPGWRYAARQMPKRVAPEPFRLSANAEGTQMRTAKRDEQEEVGSSLTFYSLLLTP